MSGKTRFQFEFDVQVEYAKALEYTKEMCTLAEWKDLAGQVILNVKCERQWWSAQCEPGRKHELPSQLLHTFGVALGNTVWPVIKLLAFTGQLHKAITFAKAQESVALGNELLLFLLSEFPREDHQEMLKCCIDELKNLESNLTE